MGSDSVGAPSLVSFQGTAGSVFSIRDIFGVIISIIVIGTRKQVKGKLPAEVILRIYLNVILVFTVSLVPVLGDVVAAALRAG